jgi:hypothetical protein
MAKWSKDKIINQVEQAKSKGNSKAALSQVDYQEVNKVCKILADEKWIDIYTEKNETSEDFTVYVYDL